MNVTLTDKQVEMLSQLMAAKNEAESRVNLVIQTLAAGVGVEKWTGAQLDIQGKTLAFTVPPEPEEA